MEKSLWLPSITMICLLLQACSASVTEPPAELIVLNGQVLTVDSEFSQAEAFAVRDGKFVAVGDNEDVNKFEGDQTRVIDAEGKTIVPGLIETHVHATGAARGETRQAFVQLGSIGEIQEWLRTEVAKTPEGDWIQLPRVDVTRIQEGRIPNRAELDEAAPEHPAVFNWQYANYQIQILNSAALKAAGITKDTPIPEGGAIPLGEDGEPTGRLENSGELIARFLERSEASDEEYLQSLEQLLGRYNEVGITSIFERGSNAAGYRDYVQLKEEDRLPVRATVTIRLDTDGTVDGTERAIAALPFQHGDGDDRVRVGPLKVRMDGGILYGTAHMREPYGEQAISFYGFDDPEHRGGAFFSEEELTNIFHTAHRLGWQMSSHVTGDAGVDTVLDAIEAANADLPDDDYRFTLIHAYFANQEAAERAARLGVAVDTQPAWFYKDGDALADVLGIDRLQKFIGVQEWRRAGVKVALNSDHMQGSGPNTSLNPYNPFLTMYAAVSRRTENGQMIGPYQRVSREDALRMMTVDAAWLSFDETRKGSIEVGKLGDFAILSDNLLTCDEERIKDIRSELTVVGGEVVYNSSEEDN
ncbi:MAG: amidohydrolase [Balneolales bacterium]